MLCSVDASVLDLFSGEIPELNVLRSDGTDDAVTILFDVVNLVGVSLYLVLLLTGCTIEDIDAVVVGHVDSTESITIISKRHGLDTSSTLFQDGACFLLASNGVPSEDQGD